MDGKAHTGLGLLVLGLLMVGVSVLNDDATDHTFVVAVVCAR